MPIITHISHRKSPIHTKPIQGESIYVHRLTKHMLCNTKQPHGCTYISFPRSISIDAHCQCTLELDLWLTPTHRMRDCKMQYTERIDMVMIGWIVHRIDNIIISSHAALFLCWDSFTFQSYLMIKIEQVWKKIDTVIQTDSPYPVSYDCSQDWFLRKCRNRRNFLFILVKWKSILFITKFKFTSND